MLASDDQVAIDAVAAKIDGLRPPSSLSIRMAHERGLGRRRRMEEIEIVGDVDAAKGRAGARRAGETTFASRGLTCSGPRRSRSSAGCLFHTPPVNLFVFGSFFNVHDYYCVAGEGKKRGRTSSSGRSVPGAALHALPDLARRARYPRAWPRRLSRGYGCSPSPSGACKFARVTRSRATCRARLGR